MSNYKELISTIYSQCLQDNKKIDCKLLHWDAIDSENHETKELVVNCLKCNSKLQIDWRKVMNMPNNTATLAET